jgi:sarcosine oxidase
MNQQPNTYSTIVIGVGTMGSAACMHLASRGERVLGIDRYPVPHDLGSHHGGSRIIRDCYFELPDYVPLLLRTRAGWEALERESIKFGADPTFPLVHRPGVLYMGAPGSEVVGRSHASGAGHGVPCEPLDARAVRTRFPQFNIPDDWSALFEPGSGFVRPERAVAAAVRVARAHGADIHEGERVIEWSETANGVQVRTDRGTYEAGSLIITAGAWTPSLARTLGVTLTPLRVPIVWLAPCDAALCASPRMPVWYIDRSIAQGEQATQAQHANSVAPVGESLHVTDIKPVGHTLPGIYGIPTAPGQDAPGGVKIALHGAGTPCDPDAPRVPATLDEIEEIRSITREFIPAAAGPALATATCLYTNSPDQHFIVDRMPGCARTWIACGFSGHGFKFMPVLGEALADLAMNGSTPLPIGFLARRA